MSTENTSIITLDHVRTMRDNLRELSTNWRAKMVPYMKETPDEDDDKTSTRIYNIINNVVRTQEWYVRFIETGQTVLDEFKPRQENAIAIVENL